jgi:hypothetical protein
MMTMRMSSDSFGSMKVAKLVLMILLPNAGMA